LFLRPAAALFDLEEMAVGINWSQVLKRCRPEVHKKIMEARSRHEELKRLIAEAKETMPKIDFAQYRQALPVMAHSLVDELEASTKNFKITKVETNSQLEVLETERIGKVNTVDHAILKFCFLDG